MKARGTQPERPGKTNPAGVLSHCQFWTTTQWETCPSETDFLCLLDNPFENHIIEKTNKRVNIKGQETWRRDTGKKKNELRKAPYDQ